MFDAHNILPLKADYTNYDPSIAQTIAELKRRAVPVNVLYLPRGEEPKVTKEFFGSRYIQGFIREHLGEAGTPAGNNR